MPSTKSIELTHLQAINEALSQLIQQAAVCPDAVKDPEAAEEPTHTSALLVACLIPNITQKIWQTCLKKAQNQHPFLESCSTLEIDSKKLPNLYNHIQKLMIQVDKTLQDTKNTQGTRASQVQVAEKHFLFFGALDYD